MKATESEWHVGEDKTKTVDDLSLEDNILSGVIIVQSSKNGEDWIPDVILTDIFTENSNLSDAFYTTKDIQLQNGCYYQVIVAYELQRKNGEEKGMFGPKDKTERKKIAEIYEFYAVSSEIDKNTANASVEPRKELGQRIKTKNDTGYSESQKIDKDDPHYGWDLGTFVINGYTAETADNGTPVFLKNVGDKVMLWFTLKQDINQLNGKDGLTISEDTNGYDQFFEVPQTNFGRGTLLIRFTDFEGNVHKPVIYTDFLAANAKTSADTRVQLFEEGDYEVSLDYEIKTGSLIPSFTNYKVIFEFSVRNGNCMVYPFDEETKRELSNNAISTKGFKLDMAKSRYLKVNVERAALNIDSNGLLTKEIRFNGPAKDNASYTDAGIYTITVKNAYTDETTEKTIYVGENKYILALAKNALTVDVLNERITQGSTIEEDGTIMDPVVEPEPESSEKEESANLEAQPAMSAVPPIEEVRENIPVSDETEATEGKLAQYIITIAIAVVVIVIFVLKLHKGKKKGGSV